MMGPASLEVLRVAAREAAESPGQSLHASLEDAARSLGESLDGRFLAADLERLELELTRYRTTFHPEQGERVLELRRAALEAMDFFAEFRPRLVGEVLSGTADEYSPIVLQLFAPTPEGVMERLLTRDIPFEESETTYQYGDGRSERVSVFAFGAGGDQVVLEVFPEERIREAPLGPGGAKLRRASRGQLQALIDGETHA
ncbi:hypothetical protein LV476_10295 [Guyparkeria hydrothermalis]|uniref:hypothetical protein n=1 Tax=Guyparkeria hydrothermalis TaxID=923 RepID=UPI0020206462|nr:hypothetical protein [Guyparkeria hydrothermalis]MCL7745324.1 hypothetical protein [Guyparkeria hydrothermalis]